MNEIQSSKDVASMLLNSSDSKVAAAARRVFSGAVLVQSDEQELCPKPSTGQNSIEQTIAKKYVSQGAAVDTTNATFQTPTMIEDANTVKQANDMNRRKVMLLPKKSSDSNCANPASTIFNPQALNDVHNALSKTLLPLDRKKVASPSERLQRSRERNKMHARKTRQRKKEQMKTLETQVDELKARQVEIKRDIEEKVTANILVELYTKCKDDVDASIDPKVEKLLKRPTEEIPDSSQVPELPALILPGQHSNRRGKGSTTMDYPDDGIDYKLLAKDRSTCSQEELDKIRRERNRMHAKRTRDRKRIFVEEMEKIIKQLSTENMLLEEYLISISDMSRSQTPTLGRSPSLGSQTPVGTPVPTIHMLGKACESDIAELFANRGTKRSLEVSSPAPCASDVSTSTLSCDNSSGQSIESSHEDTYVGKRVCVSSDKESHSYSSQAPRS